MSAAGLVMRGVLVQFGGRILGLGIAVFTLAITVRYLGASDYGVLITAVTFVGLFEAFVDFGVGTLIIRRVAAGQGSLEKLVGLNLAASLLYALPLWLLAAASGLVVYAGRPDVQVGILVLAVGLVFTVLYTCYEPVFEVKIRFGAITLSALLAKVLALGLTLLVVMRDAGIVPLFAVQVLPAFLQFVILLAVSRRHGRFRPTFDWPPMLELLRQGLPLAVVTLVGIVYFRADGVLLSLLSPPEQVGAYGLGYRIAGNLAILSVVFATAAFPSMSRASAQGVSEFNRVIGRSLEAMLVCAAPVLLFGQLLASGFIEIIGSRELVPLATAPLQGLFAATAFGYFNYVLSQAMIAHHQQRFLVRLSLVMLGFNVLLNLVLIPRWGAVGATSALVATEAVSTAAAFWRLRRLTGMPVPVRFAVRLVPALAVTTAVWWVAQPLPFLAVLGLVVAAYGASLTAFGPLRPDDLRALLAQKRQAEQQSSSTQMEGHETARTGGGTE